MSTTTEYNNDLESNIVATTIIPTLSDPHLLYLHQLSNTVRFLAIIDFIFGIYMFFYGYLGVYILVRLLCSLSGYHGALRYQYFYSLIYLGFLTFCTICECIFIFWYTRLYHEKKISDQLLIGGVIYQVIFIILKLYITRFVCIFNNLLCGLTEQQRQTLIDFNQKTIRVIYW